VGFGGVGDEFGLRFGLAGAKLECEEVFAANPVEGGGVAFEHGLVPGVEGGSDWGLVHIERGAGG
jgi:hypothetical protein